jgi:hypothetical protein
MANALTEEARVALPRPRTRSSSSPRSHSGSLHDNGQTTPPELEHHPRPKGLLGLYTNTTTQVVLLGFVCFMCPGLFNALNGLGGGGQVDPTTGANANSALYATFAVAAFFAGCVSLLCVLVLLFLSP